MKKVFSLLLASSLAVASVNAQEKTDQLTAATPSKQDKQAEKAKKEAQTQDAFNAAGLTEDEQKACRAIMKESSEKSNAVKKDAGLSDEDKKTKLKEISDEKNQKLKEAMTEAKYKLYSKARKAQKEAEQKATQK